MSVTRTQVLRVLRDAKRVVRTLPLEQQQFTLDTIRLTFDRNRKLAPGSPAAALALRESIDDLRDLKELRRKKTMHDKQVQDRTISTELKVCERVENSNTEKHIRQVRLQTAKVDRKLGLGYFTTLLEPFGPLEELQIEENGDVRATFFSQEACKAFVSGFPTIISSDVS